MEHPPEKIEAVAALIYRYSFTARMGREDWERTKQRADAGGGYSHHIVQRCYQQAFEIMELLQ